MKFSATLFACITLSLVLVSETASAGSNRSSGKSSGRSSGHSSGRSFNHRSNHNSSRNSNYRSYGQRSSSSQRNRNSSMQRNSSMKRVAPKQNYRTPQTQKFTHQNYNQKKLKNTKNSGFSKTNTYKFTPTQKQTTPNRTHHFNGKHQFNQHHKPTQRPFKTNFKPVKYNNHHNGHHAQHNNHHGHHNGHHNGHQHWNRPWCHINYRPACPSVCRRWYPVVCADPIVTPCVITACAPVYYNEFNESFSVAPAIAEEKIVAATEATPEQAEPQRLDLVAGQEFQITAEGLGTEQGMVVLEINDMGLPAKIEKWEDKALDFQTPQIGLSKATEAKMHIMNKKGQLLATLDINLLPEGSAEATQVAAN